MNKKAAIIISSVLASILAVGTTIGIVAYSSSKNKNNNKTTNTGEQYSSSVEVKDDVALAKATPALLEKVNNSDDSYIELTDSEYKYLKENNDKNVLAFKNDQQITRVTTIKKNDDKYYLVNATIDEIFDEFDYSYQKEDELTQHKMKTAPSVRRLFGNPGASIFPLEFGFTIEVTTGKEEDKMLSGSAGVYVYAGVDFSITNFDFSMKYNIVEGLRAKCDFNYSLDANLLLGMYLSLKYGEKGVDEVRSLLSLNDEPYYHKDQYTPDDHNNLAVIDEKLYEKCTRNKVTIDLSNTDFFPFYDEIVTGIKHRPIEWNIANITLPFFQMLGEDAPIVVPIKMYIDVNGEIKVTLSDKISFIQKGQVSYDFNSRRSNPSIYKHTVTEKVFKNTIAISGELAAFMDVGFAVQFSIAQVEFLEVTIYARIALYGYFNAIFQADFINNNQIFFMQSSLTLGIFFNADLNFRVGVSLIHEHEFAFSVNLVSIPIIKVNLTPSAEIYVMHNFKPIGPEEYEKYHVDLTDFINGGLISYNPDIVIDWENGDYIDLQGKTLPKVTDITFDDGFNRYEGEEVEVSISIDNPYFFIVHSITLDVGNKQITINKEQMAEVGNTGVIKFNINLPEVSSDHIELSLKVTNMVVRMEDNETNIPVTKDLGSEKNITIYSLGDGSKENPYKIFKLEHLKDLNNKSGYAKMMRDINFSYDEILNSSINFNGSFDGNGFIITNMRLIGEENIALFQSIDAESKVENLKLIHCVAKASNLVSLISNKNNGTISDCLLRDCKVESNSHNSLVSTNNNGAINNIIISYCSVRLSSDGAGFIASKNNGDGSINNNVISNSIIEAGSYVGGITGQNNGVIEDNHVNYCTIEGKDNVGGLVGYNKYILSNNEVLSTDITGLNNIGGIAGESIYEITNSVLTKSNIFGNNYVGGIVGKTSASVSNSTLEDIYLSGNQYVGGIAGYAKGNDLVVKDGVISVVIKGNQYVGGLVGYLDTGSLYTNSFVKNIVDENGNPIDDCGDYGIGGIKVL